MKAESLREQGAPTINTDNPTLRNLRFCKSIIPEPNTPEAKLHYYGSAYPRIVKSNFKVPSNWRVVESYKDGEVFVEKERREDGSLIPGATSRGRVLAHTCEKPYDDCYNGFWGRWTNDPRFQVKKRAGIRIGILIT
jgi:hypothetical protein